MQTRSRRMGFDHRHTLARFLRHSVQALGVTTPRPLLRFAETCEADVAAAFDVVPAPVVELVEGLVDEDPGVGLPCEGAPEWVAEVG